METLRSSLLELIRLVSLGRTVEAMQRYYADDVIVFENRERARASLQSCLKYERAQLARMPSPPTFRAVRYALDEEKQVAFVEWVIRFTSAQGRPMRLEEVAVQEWDRGKIAIERFYYEGLIDEGDSQSPPPSDPDLSV